MAAILGVETNYSLRETGHTTSIANDDIAKLSYFVHCVNSCLKLSPDVLPTRLTQYQSYQRLDESDKTALVAVCVIFEPDLIMNKIFFPVSNNHPALGGHSNKFYEVKEAKTIVGAISDTKDTVLIQGQQVQVSSMMVCSLNWCETYYLNPLKRQLWRITGNRPTNNNRIGYRTNDSADNYFPPNSRRRSTRCCSKTCCGMFSVLIALGLFIGSFFLPWYGMQVTAAVDGVDCSVLVEWDWKYEYCKIGSNCPATTNRTLLCPQGEKYNWHDWCREEAISGCPAESVYSTTFRLLIAGCCASFLSLFGFCYRGIKEIRSKCLIFMILISMVLIGAALLVFSLNLPGSLNCDKNVIAQTHPNNNPCKKFWGSARSDDGSLKLEWAPLGWILATIGGAFLLLAFLLSFTRPHGRNGYTRIQ